MPVCRPNDTLGATLVSMTATIILRARFLLAQDRCTNGERLCLPLFQYVPCYREVAKQLLFGHAKLLIVSIPMKKKKKKKEEAKSNIPAIMTHIQVIHIIKLL